MSTLPTTEKKSEELQPARDVGPHGRRLSQRHREWLAGYLFVAPDTLGLAIFVGIPMLLGLGFGLFDVSGFGGYTFVGLANYKRMFSDALFMESLRVTVLYVVVFVPLLFVVSLALALLVSQKIPFMGIFRTLFFLPNVVSLVVVGFVWQFILVDRIGVVNNLLAAVGITGISWLGDPHLALWTVIAVSIWFLMGYYMIIFLGGLQDIPREYYDAARVDGAGPWTTFKDITWPLLKPTSFFVLLVSLVASVAGLQAFNLIYIMTIGGPANSTSLGIFYIYQQAFQFGDFGYAAAMASFLVFLLLIATAILFVVTKGGRFESD